MIHATYDDTIEVKLNCRCTIFFVIKGIYNDAFPHECVIEELEYESHEACPKHAKLDFDDYENEVILPVKEALFSIGSEKLGELLVQGYGTFKLYTNIKILIYDKYNDNNIEEWSVWETREKAYVWLTQELDISYLNDNFQKVASSNCEIDCPLCKASYVRYGNETTYRLEED